MKKPKRQYFRGTLQQRLVHYAPPCGKRRCWIWVGTQRKGYGLVWLGDGRQREAHIVAWELENGGLWSARGRVVRHSCDTPLCCNPAHLSIGTHADNVADKVGRERHDRGSKHGMSKLDEKTVHKIRKLAASGVPQKIIATKFGISQPNVSLIVNRKAWAHIE